MAWATPQAEIEVALATHPAVVAGVAEVAGMIEATAKALARVRAYATGNYFDLIVTTEAPGAGRYVTATSPHAWFVEEGTGIFGPKHTVIDAASTTASGRFKFDVMDQGAPRTVVTQFQRGRPARHVMRDAAVQVASLPGLRWTAMGVT